MSETLNTVSGKHNICDRLQLDPKSVKRLVSTAGLPITIIGEGNGTRWFCDWDAVKAWFSSPHLNAKRAT